MAKTISVDQLVYAAAGPHKPEPEYEFRRRTFRRRPKQPGQHETKYDYTRR